MPDWMLWLHLLACGTLHHPDAQEHGSCTFDSSGGTLESARTPQPNRIELECSCESSGDGQVLIQRVRVGPGPGSALLTSSKVMLTLNSKDHTVKWQGPEDSASSACEPSQAGSSGQLLSRLEPWAARPRDGQ